MKRITFLLSTLFLLAALLSAQTQNPAPLEITYIANEGFLIASGNDKILIDALQRGGIPAYESPSPQLLEELETAQGAFAGVNLVLVSHHHRDHFNAQSVARHLQSNPRARFISSDQVFEKVAAALPGGKTIAGRMRGTYPPLPERSHHTVGGIELEIFRLSHGTGRFASIQNLGQIFTLGGRKFLHIGDAEAEAESFSKHRLTEDKIDFAFVPYWFLMDEKGRRFVTELIRPRHVIAMHIPPEDLPEVTKKIRAVFPRAVIFTRQGKTTTF